MHRSKIPGTQESMCPGLENEPVLTYTPRRKIERFHQLSYMEKQRKKNDKCFQISGKIAGERIRLKN